MLSAIYLGDSSSKGVLLWTLRKFSGINSEKVEILHQKLLENVGGDYLASLYVDESYIIVSFPKASDIEEHLTERIEIYSTKTFETLHYISSVHLVHYSSGYLVVASCIAEHIEYTNNSLYFRFYI